MMLLYGNPDNNSDILNYEIGHDYIIIQFKDGSMYLYNHKITGVSHTEQMKIIAFTGKGLNKYINTHVKKNYAAKLR